MKNQKTEITIPPFRVQATNGLSLFSDSFSFIRKHKQYWMLWVPALFGLLLSASALFAATYFLPIFQLSILEWLPFDEWSSKAGGIVERVIGVLFFVAAGAGLLVAYISIYKFVILTVMAPFFAIISERVEEIETGRSYPFSWSQLIQDSLRGIKISLFNFLKEISLVFVLFLMGFVPGLGFIAAPLIFTVQSYFMGFSMIDYYLERRRFSAKESRVLISKLKGLSLSIGGSFNLLLFVPLLGVLIGPPLAAIAATRSMIALEQKQENA